MEEGRNDLFHYILHGFDGMSSRGRVKQVWKLGFHLLVRGLSSIILSHVRHEGTEIQFLGRSVQKKQMIRWWEDSAVPENLTVWSKLAKLESMNRIQILSEASTVMLAGFLLQIWNRAELGYVLKWVLVNDISCLDIVSGGMLFKGGFQGKNDIFLPRLPELQTIEERVLLCLSVKWCHYLKNKPSCCHRNCSLAF